MCVVYCSGQIFCELHMKIKERKSKNINLIVYKKLFQFMFIWRH